MLPTENFEAVPCALCGSQNSELVIRTPDRNYDVPGEFQVVRCTTCGLVYTNPRPRLEVLGEYYPSDYGPHNKSNASSQVIPGRLERIKQLVKDGVADTFYFRKPSKAIQKATLLPFATWSKISRMILLPSPDGSQARLLDVGCGTGTFLASMVGRWPELYGVEPDRDAAEIAATIPKARIHMGDLQSAGYPDRFFDLVVMWHVLEHVPNPLETLTEIHRVLKPNGHLVIMLPNVSSLEFSMFAGNWKGLDLPRHFYHFSPVTLRYMLNLAGLSVLRINHQFEPATIYASILNLSKTRWHSFASISMRIAQGPVLGIISAVLALANSSGVMVAYAVRKE